MLVLEPKGVGKEFWWFSCVDDVLATVSNYYNIEYRFSYANTWNFSYTSFLENPEMLFSERLHTEAAVDRYSFLEKYHRTKMIYHYSQNVEELLLIVKEEIAANRPCALRMDSFYLPWDLALGNMHTNHVCIPVAVDEEKGEIVVVDPYHRKVDLKFPIEKLNEASGFCITFQIDKIKNEDFDCISILKDVVEKILGIGSVQNEFEGMRTFAKDFKEHFNPSIDLKDKNGSFHKSAFNYRLTELASGRSFARQALLYISEREYNDEIKAISNAIRRMVSRFNYASALLQRTFRMEHINSDNANNDHSSNMDEKAVIEMVSNVFLDEADFEEETAKKLLEVLNNILENRGNNKSLNRDKDSQLEASIDDQADTLTNQYKIDLTAYFNNIGFGTLKQLSNADFTGYGEYLLSEDLPANEEWNHENIYLNFPRIQDGHPDNISCKKQLIEFEPFDCEQIAILANAEWGDFYDCIKVCYEDGAVIDYDFGVSDFAFGKRYSEIIVYRGRSAKVEEGIPIPMHNEKKICLVKLNISKGKVSKIILPDCGNMHVFSITLLGK